MKFLEITPQSEPLEIFEKFVKDFIPDIFTALRNHPRLDVDRENPLSDDEVVQLFETILKSLTMSNNLCKHSYQRSAYSIKVEMRIKNSSFVWLRLIPLNEAKEPITGEKENVSVVVPCDFKEIDDLNKEGYGTVIVFNKVFPPKD